MNLLYNKAYADFIFVSKSQQTTGGNTMINATLVHFERVNTRDNMTREFRVESQGKIKSIKVASYSKGWATIVPTHICHIEDLA